MQHNIEMPKDYVRIKINGNRKLVDEHIGSHCLGLRSQIFLYGRDSVLKDNYRKTIEWLGHLQRNDSWQGNSIQTVGDALDAIADGVIEDWKVSKWIQDGYFWREIEKEAVREGYPGLVEFLD